MKYPLPACSFFSLTVDPYLCFSVCLEFFFKTACQFFFHEVKVSSNLEFTELVFLKNIVLKFLSQEGLKWTQKVVFLVLSNINAWNFLYFLHQDTQLESIDYFVKNLVFEIFRLKWAKMGPKQGFSSFIENWNEELSWFFSYKHLKFN